ncbi:MAG: peptidylprolyl isomerase [Thermoanaerobaculia bacterium]
MSKTISLLPPLGLALLLSLGSGCKAAPDKSVLAGVPGGKAAPAGQPAASPQAATPAGSASTAAPGQPAPLNLPGAPAVAAKPGAAGTLPPDKVPAVVARVNGKEIKKDELMDGAQMVQMRMAQTGQRLNPTADLYRQVLDQLIAINLLQQDARAQGVTISDDEVQQAVAARKRNFPNEETYKKALASAGVTEKDLRDRAREQLTLQKYVATKIAPKAAVSDQAVRDFYEKHKAEMQVPERLHLRHILLKVDDKASPADREKARQKAQDILKRLQAGEDFGKLAEQYSDDPGSKTRGGDLGPVAKGQTAPQFEAAAFALKKPNDLSPVVEAPYGFQIVQLVQRQEPTVLAFNQVKDRIAALLKQQEVQKMFQNRATALRAKSKVEIFI